jgi:hypothetical protein
VDCRLYTAANTRTRYTGVFKSLASFKGRWKSLAVGGSLDWLCSPYRCVGKECCSSQDRDVQFGCTVPDESDQRLDGERLSD